MLDGKGKDVGCQRPRHLREFHVNPRTHPGGKVSRSVSCSAEKSALQSGNCEVSRLGVECTSLRHYKRLSVCFMCIYSIYQQMYSFEMSRT